MAKMVFGNWTSGDGIKPAAVDHLRVTGNKTACGIDLTKRSVLSWSQRDMATCRRCLAAAKPQRAAS